MARLNLAFQIIGTHLTSLPPISHPANHGLTTDDTLTVFISRHDFR